MDETPVLHNVQNRLQVPLAGYVDPRRIVYAIERPSEEAEAAEALAGNEEED